MRKFLFLSLEMMVLALVMYAGGRGASSGKEKVANSFHDYMFSSKAPRSAYSKAFLAPSSGSTSASKTSGKGKGVTDKG